MQEATELTGVQPPGMPFSLRGWLRWAALAVTVIGWVEDRFLLALLIVAAGLLLLQALVLALCTRGFSRTMAGHDQQAGSV